MTKRPQSEHDKARAAGMTPKECARWLAYLAMKREQRKPPITLAEAVRQIRDVRP